MYKLLVTCLFDYISLCCHQQYTIHIYTHTNTNMLVKDFTPCTARLHIYLFLRSSHSQHAHKLALLINLHCNITHKGRYCRNGQIDFQLQARRSLVITKILYKEIEQKIPHIHEKPKPISIPSLITHTHRTTVFLRINLNLHHPLPRLHCTRVEVELRSVPS